MAAAARHIVTPGNKGLLLDALVTFLAEQRLSLEQPPLARAQARQVSSIRRAQVENGAQAAQAVRAPVGDGVGDGPPFFARRSKLCSTSPSASSIATAPKRKGCKPSRLIIA